MTVISYVTNQATEADPANLTIANVDLLIGASSWDIRCLTLTEVRWQTPPPKALLLKYRNTGSSGREPAYRRLLASAFESFGGTMDALTLDSLDAVNAWSLLKSYVLKVYNEYGRPIRVALDITSVPRYVWLNLLGYGAQTGIVSSFEFLYSAAHEYEFHGDTGVFSDGRWKPRAIATLGHGAVPSAESLLVVSGGFEGANTLRLVNALEPDRVLVALSSSGQSANDRLARRANAPLAEQYGLAGELISLPLNDVRGSIGNLRAALRNQHGIHERELATSFLLCGSKISALAIGLFALEQDVAQIYFSDPQRRLETTASSVEWVTCVTVAL